MNTLKLSGKKFDISTILAFRVLLLLLKTASVFLIAKELGPEIQASYAILTSLLIVFSQMSRTGVDVGGMYFCNKLGDDKDVAVQRIIPTALVSSLFFALTACGIIYIFVPSVLETLGWYFIPVCLLSIVSMGVRANLKTIFLLHQRVQFYNLLGLFQPIFVLAVIFLARDNTDVIKDIAVAYCLGALLDVILAFIVIHKKLVRIDKWRFDGAFKYIKYGFRVCVANALMLLLHKSDPVILDKFVSSKEVGIYSFAMLISEKVFYIIEVLHGYLYASFTEKKEKQNDLILKLLLVTMCLVLLIGLVIYFSSKYIIEIYFQQYLESMHLVKILITGCGFMACYLFLNAYLTATNKVNVVIVAVPGAIVVKSVLCLALIPIYGMVGAAWASLISYFLLAVFVLYHSGITSAFVIHPKNHWTNK